MTNRPPPTENVVCPGYFLVGWVHRVDEYHPLAQLERAGYQIRQMG